MRPKSIVNFERVIALMVFALVADLALTWDRQVAGLAGTGLTSGMLIGAYGVGLGIFLLLIGFITRGRSNVARWIYVVLTVGGIVYLLIGDLAPAQELPLLLLEIAQWLLAFTGLWLLFRPDARTWFEAELS